MSTEKPTKDVIITAFKKFHGGHEKTDPNEIVRLFNELQPEIQKRYLTAVQEKQKTK